MRSSRIRRRTTTDQTRFELPLYTVAEAARIVDVPPSTLATWAKGYVRVPMRGSRVAKAQPARDSAEVDAGAEQSRGDEVAEVVEADVFEPDARQ